MRENKSKLIIEGNSLYEIDMDCINKKCRGETCTNQQKNQMSASSECKKDRKNNNRRN